MIRPRTCTVMVADLERTISVQEAQDMMASLRKRTSEIEQSPSPVEREHQQELENVAGNDAPETDMERMTREIQMRTQQRRQERREIEEKRRLEQQAIDEKMRISREKLSGGRPAR